MTLRTAEAAPQNQAIIVVTTTAATLSKLKPDQLISSINPSVDKFHLGDILRANLTTNLNPEKTPFSPALLEIRNYWVDTDNTLTVNGLLMILAAKGLQPEIKKVTQLENSSLLLLFSFKRNRGINFLVSKTIEFGIILEKPEPIREPLNHRQRLLVGIANFLLTISENTRQFAKVY